MGYHDRTNGKKCRSMAERDIRGPSWGKGMEKGPGRVRTPSRRILGVGVGVKVVLYHRK